MHERTSFFEISDAHKCLLSSCTQVDVSLNNLRVEGMAPFESVLCSSNCVLCELNVSANAIISSGGQPIIERIVSKTSFTWVQDEPGGKACLILRKL